MTAPPFILSPTSLTEFPGVSPCVRVVIDTNLLVAYWCERPGLFAKIAEGKTEEARALAVLRWFIVMLVPSSCACRSSSKLFLEYPQRPIYITQ